jgi:hypothetical protein
MLMAGSPLLLRLLDATWSHAAEPAKTAEPKALLPHAPAPVWALRNECLSILRELCFTTPFFSESLAANATCVARFLELTSHKVRHASCALWCPPPRSSSRQHPHHFHPGGDRSSTQRPSVPRSDRRDVLGRDTVAPYPFGPAATGN